MSTKCRCAACSTTPARTYTEEFRHACEVRVVASLPSKDRRRIYLADVSVKRGGASAQRIIDALKRMHAGAGRSYA